VVIAADHGAQPDTPGAPARCEYDDATNAWSTAYFCRAGIHGFQHVAVNPYTGDVYQRVGINIMRHDGSYEGVAVAPMNYNTSQLATVALMWWPSAWPGAGAQGVLTVYIGEWGTIAAYDPLANRWLPLLQDMLPGQKGYYHNVSAYSARHKCLVYGGGNTFSGVNPVDGQIWRLNADLTKTRLPDSPHRVGIHSGMNMVSGPDGNVYFLGFGEFWRLDPSGAGTWTKLTMPSGILDPGNQKSVFSSDTPFGVVYVDSERTRAPKKARMWIYRP
jgi:hypothetical protein